MRQWKQSDHCGALWATAMMHRALHWTALLVFQVVGLALLADDAITPSAAQLSRWQEELDAEDFQVRVRATDELRRAKHAAVDVVTQSAMSTSLEVATRAEAILKAWIEDEDAGMARTAREVIGRLAKHPTPSIARRGLALQKQIAEIAETAAYKRLLDRGAARDDEVAIDGESGVGAPTCLVFGDQWKGTAEDFRLLSDLPRLRQVQIAINKPNSILKHLAGLSATRLTLAGTDLDDDGLSELPALPLTFLDLSNTLVEDGGMERVSKLAKLETLLLDGTLISDRGLDAIQALPELRRLQLSKTRVSSRGFCALAKLPRLEVLDVSSSNFSAEALEALSGSKTLQKIEAQRSRLTIVDIQDFQRRHPDAKFRIGLQDDDRR